MKDTRDTVSKTNAARLGARDHARRLRRLPCGRSHPVLRGRRCVDGRKRGEKREVRNGMEEARRKTCRGDKGSTRRAWTRWDAKDEDASEDGIVRTQSDAREVEADR